MKLRAKDESLGELIPVGMWRSEWSEEPCESVDSLPESSAELPSAAQLAPRWRWRSAKALFLSTAFLSAAGAALVLAGALTISAGTREVRVATSPPPAPPATPPPALPDTGLPDCAAAAPDRATYLRAVSSAERAAWGVALSEVQSGTARQAKVAHALRQRPVLRLSLRVWVLVSEGAPWEAWMPEATEALAARLRAALAPARVSVELTGLVAVPATEALVAACYAGEARGELRCLEDYSPLRRLDLALDRDAGPAHLARAFPELVSRPAGSAVDVVVFGTLNALAAGPQFPTAEDEGGHAGRAPPPGTASPPRAEAGAISTPPLPTSPPLMLGLRREALQASPSSLVHALGHALGLAHAFSAEDSCSVDADGLGDTPRQRRAYVASCPDSASGGLCPGSRGAAPWHNYMDLSTDACRRTFTPLQAARLRAVLEVHYPTLGVEDWGEQTAGEGGKRQRNDSTAGSLPAAMREWAFARSDAMDGQDRSSPLEPSASPLPAVPGDAPETSFPAPSQPPLLPAPPPRPLPLLLRRPLCTIPLRRAWQASAPGPRAQRAQQASALLLGATGSPALQRLSDPGSQAALAFQVFDPGRDDASPALPDASCPPSLGPAAAGLGACACAGVPGPWLGRLARRELVAAVRLLLPVRGALGAAWAREGEGGEAVGGAARVEAKERLGSLRVEIRTGDVATWTDQQPCATAELSTPSVSLLLSCATPLPARFVSVRLSWSADDGWGPPASSPPACICRVEALASLQAPASPAALALSPWPARAAQAASWTAAQRPERAEASGAREARAALAEPVPAAAPRRSSTAAGPRAVWALSARLEDAHVAGLRLVLAPGEAGACRTAGEGAGGCAAESGDAPETPEGGDAPAAVEGGDAAAMTRGDGAALDLAVYVGARGLAEALAGREDGDEFGENLMANASVCAPFRTLAPSPVPVEIWCADLREGPEVVVVARPAPGSRPPLVVLALSEVEILTLTQAPLLDALVRSPPAALLAAPPELQSRAAQVLGGEQCVQGGKEALWELQLTTALPLRALAVGARGGVIEVVGPDGGIAASRRLGNDGDGAATVADASADDLGPVLTDSPFFLNPVWAVGLRVRAFEQLCSVRAFALDVNATAGPPLTVPLGQAARSDRPPDAVFRAAGAGAALADGDVETCVVSSGPSSPLDLAAQQGMWVRAVTLVGAELGLNVTVRAEPSGSPSDAAAIVCGRPEGTLLTPFVPTRVACTEPIFTDRISISSIGDRLALCEVLVFGAT